MKTEKVPALPWQLELQDPEVHLKNRGKVEGWYYPLTQFKSTSRTASLASGSITIKQNVSAKSASHTFSKAQESILRPFSVTTYDQSQSVRGQFYFATIQNLQGKALAYSFASGQETSVTSFVQLQGKVISNSHTANPCIYYVDYASTFFSQSFFSESQVAQAVPLKSKTQSISFARANKSSPFALLIKATSKVICGTDSLAKITRSFNLYTDTIVQSYSFAQRSISQLINSKAYSNSNSIVAPSISKPLTSEILSDAYSYIPKSIKLGLNSNYYSQTDLKGNEIVTRPLGAESISPSSPNISFSKKINTTSSAMLIGLMNGGETVARVLNGVADSISIAQKTLGSVTRLFVSGSISISFSNTTTHLTSNLYSSFHSQSFVNGGQIFITRPLGSIANSANPFHGEVSKKITTQTKAATITLSDGSEIVNRPLASSANSQNPFKSNPSLRREIESGSLSQAQALAASFGKKLNLAAQSQANTELIGSEIVNRILASTVLSDSNLDASISVLHKTYGTTISQTKLTGQEIVVRPLSSKSVDETNLDANISINRPIDSKVILESQSAAQNPFIKVGLSSEFKVLSSSHVNEIINRPLSSQSNDISHANSQSYNTLMNIYGSAISDSFANSASMNKKLNLSSEIVVQTYISGTDNYFGTTQKEVGFVETNEQGAINLAPFNYGTNNSFN